MTERKQLSLPSYRCPQCGAKHVLYARDRVNWAHHRLIPLEELGKEDYTACVMECPKCRSMLALLQEMIVLNVYDIGIAS